jgi:hypothetical protein
VPMICSHDEGKKSGTISSDMLEYIKLGSVWGTFGIQLSAYVLATPPENAHFATIQKGESGYYKCVNIHLKTKFGGNNLSSKIVACEVEECIASLMKTGFPVNPAWMDQNCCYWYRKYGGDDNSRDGRKKDIFFFDKNGRVFLPIRTRGNQAGRPLVHLNIMLHEGRMV